MTYDAAVEQRSELAEEFARQAENPHDADQHFTGFCWRYRDSLAAALTEWARLRRIHRSECNALKDDESDSALYDFQECTCKGWDAEVRRRALEQAEQACRDVAHRLSERAIYPGVDIAARGASLCVDAIAKLKEQS